MPKTKTCGFCDEKAEFTVSKSKNGYFMETCFCRGHLSSYRNEFYSKLKTLRKETENLLLYNTAEDLRVAGKGAVLLCPGCGICVETFLSAGFPKCDMCVETFFAHLSDIMEGKSFFDSDFEQINEEEDILDVEFTEVKLTAEESLQKKLAKAIDSQDFDEAIFLRNELRKLQENEKSREKPQTSPEDIPHSEDHRKEI